MRALRLCVVMFFGMACGDISSSGGGDGSAEAESGSGGATTSTASTSGSDDDIASSEGPPVRDLPGPDEVEAPPICVGFGACFAWCGVRLSGDRCEPIEVTELDAEALGPLLCDPLVVDVEAGNARPAAGSTDDDVRCFLQLLRYGSSGVGELYWRDTSSWRRGHLLVEGLGNGYARLEMQLLRVMPDCGDAIAMSAAAAHVRAERDPLFDTCLDTVEDIDVVACVLGPAATFFDDHDWVYDVAFPWLSGTCGVP